MIQIDGAEKSGSGTLVRFAIALCSLTRQSLHMVRIREKRKKPGLRPQHLQAVKACAELTSGLFQGDSVGSRELLFHPGESIRGGNHKWDIGTAGSATMLAFTLIPLGLFAEATCYINLRGGLFQDFAPTAFHMQQILLPLLSQMGAEVSLEIVRPGYVPLGKGELRLVVEPVAAPLRGIDKREQGKVHKLRAVSLASHLGREMVAGRMADRCRELLAPKGYSAEISTIEDTTALQKGAALLLWAETDTGCLIGSDRAGKRGRSSESIADYVEKAFLEDMSTGATVDRFTADQLILFAGLASGLSRYFVPHLTDHIESSLWLIEKILGARTQLNGRMISIDGIGFFGK
ncbi:MAG: RNA 3'-terminal phosphate cyclase [Syntrophobacteraceae bacterium]